MAPTEETDPDRYTRLPTARVPENEVSAAQLDEPSVDALERELEQEGAVVTEDWRPPEDTEVDADRRGEPRLAPWALMSAIVALFASLFVGWGIPIAIVSVVAAVMSLRREGESRTLSVWALVLGLVATLYSLGWLLWVAYRFGWFG